MLRASAWAVPAIALAVATPAAAASGNQAQAQSRIVRAGEGQHTNWTTTNSPSTHPGIRFGTSIAGTSYPARQATLVFRPEPPLPVGSTVPAGYAATALISLGQNPLQSQISGPASTVPQSGELIYTVAVPAVTGDPDAGYQAGLTAGVTFRAVPQVLGTWVVQDFGSGTVVFTRSGTTYRAQLLAQIPN